MIRNKRMIVGAFVSLLVTFIPVYVCADRHESCVVFCVGIEN